LKRKIIILTILFAIIGLFLFPHSDARGAEEIIKDKITTVDKPSPWLRVLISLCLVLALILLCSGGAKKLIGKNLIPSRGRSQIETVASSYLAPKKKIVLVKVYDELLLLAVSASQISFLSKISSPEVIEPGNLPANDKNSDESFKKELNLLFSPQQREDSMNYVSTITDLIQNAVFRFKRSSRN